MPTTALPPLVEDWDTATDDEYIEGMTEYFVASKQSIAPVQKHLPGQHEQQSHAGGRGGAITARAEPMRLSELTDMSNKRQAEMSADARSGVRAYTNYNFQDINGVLRNGDDHKMTRFNTKESVETYTRQMDEAMASSGGMPRDTEVYRGIRIKEDGTDYIKPEVGYEWTDDGFTSVTIDRSYAQEWADHMQQRPRSQGDPKASAIIAVRVPSGENGGPNVVPMDGFSGAPHEKEIIVNRGTKWRVTKAEKDANDIWQMEAEAVPNG